MKNYEHGKLMSVTVTIPSKTAVDVLLRAIGVEVKGLLEVMQKCDTNDFIQYCAYNLAESQIEELNKIRKQLQE